MNQSETTLPGANRNLPLVLTSFIGRERELAELKRLLASSRLVTLTGAAGCGKTRLALRTAKETRLAHGICWVELARLEDPALVPQTVAKALGVPQQAERPAVETLLEVLQERELLLALDNCEHLLSACRELTTRVLAETDVTVLATSRQPLGVNGERLYPVSPLATPPVLHPPDDADGIAHYDAVQLFVERARATVPGFELTSRNAGVIAGICRNLDGIPLAIELAAARVNVLAVEQIAARMDDQFDLLPSTTPHTYSHHDTLWAAIDWSHDLLTAPEQILLRRLEVFAGGCSLSSAEAICDGNGIEQNQILHLLSSLVDKSLVVADTVQRTEARYSLLEPIRQYAREKLAASDERRALRDRHLAYTLQVTEETAPKLKGEYQQLWLDWLEGEYDNIRAALDWSLETDRIEAGLRIAVAVYQFWTIRDYAEEALAWLERLLDQADKETPALVQANALAYAAFLAGFRGDSTAQAAYGREAADLANALGAEGHSALAWARAGAAYAHGRPGPLPSGGSALVWALDAQAYGSRTEGDYETEFAVYKRVIQLQREEGERYFLGVYLIKAGFAAWSLGKYKKARAMVDEGLPLLREAGNLYSIAMTLNGSGDLARCEGNYTRAQADYEESIALLREVRAVRDLASALHNLGHTCLHLGDLQRARDLFSESITLQQAQQNTPGIAECLIGYAALAAAGDRPADAARLLAAAIAIGGKRVATAWAATRLEYEQVLNRVRTTLAEAAFLREQAAGRTLSLEQALGLAEEVEREVIAAHEARSRLDELTPRERQVVALIAQAKSNGEIAEELVISKRTVEKHISNIRSKLTFDKRAEIVRWALESGLLNQSEKTSP